MTLSGVCGGIVVNRFSDLGVPVIFFMFVSDDDLSVANFGGSGAGDRRALGGILEFRQLLVFWASCC
jgi:hypothetical protein